MPQGRAQHPVPLTQVPARRWRLKHRMTWAIIYLFLGFEGWKAHGVLREHMLNQTRLNQETEFSATPELGAERPCLSETCQSLWGRAGHLQTPAQQGAPIPAEFPRRPASCPAMPWSQGQREKLAQGRKGPMRNKNNNFLLVLKAGSFQRTSGKQAS